MQERWVVIVALIAMVAATSGCRCDVEKPPSVTPAAPPPAPAPAPKEEYPRQPGPARAETPAQIQAAKKEADALIAALLDGDISPRQVTSVADIRGYRLYRRRYFGQARAWFEAAVKVDDTFEMALYNAARAAAMVADLDGARTHLDRLRALGTPLARERLALAAVDPDLTAIRNAPAPAPAPARTDATVARDAATR